MKLKQILTTKQPILTEAISITVANKTYQISIANEKFVITSPSGTFSYKLETPGFLSVTIPIIDIMQRGTGYVLKYKHPITKSVIESPVALDTIQSLLVKLGIAELPLAVKTPDGVTQDLVFIKA